MPTTNSSNLFTTNNILVGFSPNDFFYAQAQDENIMPKDPNFCPSINMYNPTWDSSCNSINFIDNSYNCISKELCKNLDKVKKISQHQTQHSESEGKYLDTSSLYNFSFMNIINISIGTLALFIFIVRNRNIS